MGFGSQTRFLGSANWQAPLKRLFRFGAAAKAVVACLGGAGAVWLWNGTGPNPCSLGFASLVFEAAYIAAMVVRGGVGPGELRLLRRSLHWGIPRNEGG